MVGLPQADQAFVGEQDADMALGVFRAQDSTQELLLLFIIYGLLVFAKVPEWRSVWRSTPTCMAPGCEMDKGKAGKEWKEGARGTRTT